MSTVSGVRDFIAGAWVFAGLLLDLNSQLTTDDAPWWAEVLGPVLAIGLVLRGGIHVGAALFGRDVLGECIDPHVDKQDVTLASPVIDMRGHRLDLFARLVTAAIALGLWGMVEAASHPVGAAYLALQLGVCIADPIAFVAWRFAAADKPEDMITKSQTEDA